MWLKPWKMSSLLLFVNIQSLLMAGRWNRLWDNSLQFNRGKSSYNAEMQVWISVYSWTICALTASAVTPPREALKWHPYDINLLAHFVEPVEYDLTTGFYKFCLYQWASLPPGLPSPRGILLSSDSADLHNNSFLWNLLVTTNICRQNLSNPSKQPHVCCHFSWLWAHLFGLPFQLSLALCS